MVERASVFQTTQIGVEVTPGTSVASNRALQSLSIIPSPKADVQTFRAMGRKYKSMAVMGKEWTLSKIEGLATYTEIIYLLASLVGYAAPVRQSTTSAYLWTFESDTDGPDTCKTYTVEQGGSVRAHKFTHGLVTSGGMNISREKIAVTGEMIGKALTDSITMTSSPTLLALIPILPTDIDIFMADTHTGLTSATALARVLSVNWNVGDRQSPVFPLGTANGTGFAAMVEKEPTTAVDIVMEADAEGMALLPVMRNGTRKFLRVLATGDTIESTYAYKFQADFSLQVTEPREFSDEDGVFSVGWGFELFHDPTWGKAYEFQVMNALSTL